MDADEIAELRAELTALRDRQQIQDAIYRYSRGIDRLDEDVFASVFWPDGGYPQGRNTGPRDEFVPKLIQTVAPAILAGTQHLVGNILIDLRGDEAFVESYVIAHHLTHPSPESNRAVLGPEGLEVPGADESDANILIIGLRYFDRFEKRDDEWRIRERRLIFDWSHAGPYRGIRNGGLYDGTPLRGERSRTDVTYAQGGSFAAFSTDPT